MNKNWGEIVTDYIVNNNYFSLSEQERQEAKSIVIELRKKVELSDKEQVRMSRCNRYLEQLTYYEKIENPKNDHAPLKETEKNQEGIWINYCYDFDIPKVDEYIDENKKRLPLKFSDLLNEHIIKYNFTESELARKTEIDRGTINHYCNDKRLPTHDHILAFAIAFHLNMDELMLFMHSAGKNFPLDERDLTVEYYIKHQIYDIDRINDELFHRGFDVLIKHKEN